jgi:hypothetical protein
MKKVSVICLLAAVGIFISGCCYQEKFPELTVINFASSRDANHNFGRRTYLVMLYKQNGNYFLQSHIPDHKEQVRIVFTRELGKNIVIDAAGLKLKNGQMTVEYQASNGEWRTAGVPFGDFYGDKHISEVKSIEYLPYEPVSEKYGVAGVSKQEELGVENFLPELQKHIRNNDANAISKMIIYPIEWHDVWLENRHDFLKYYPQIFTEKVKKDLLKLQNKDIFCNYQGFMINFGMWFHIGGNGKAYFFKFK